MLQRSTTTRKLEGSNLVYPTLCVTNEHAQSPRRKYDPRHRDFRPTVSLSRPPPVRLNPAPVSEAAAVVITPSSRVACETSPWKTGRSGGCSTSPGTSSRADALVSRCLPESCDDAAIRVHRTPRDRRYERAECVRMAGAREQTNRTKPPRGT